MRPLHRRRLGELLGAEHIALYIYIYGGENI